MDNIHFIEAVGSKFYFPEEYSNEDLRTEFVNPNLIYYASSQFEYSVKINVYRNIPNTEIIIDPIFINFLICFCLILVGICYIFIIKRNR